MASYILQRTLQMLVVVFGVVTVTFFVVRLVPGDPARLMEPPGTSETVLQQTRARLETEAMEGLPVDKVTMNDDRVLYGKVLDETAELVNLERKIGAGSLVKTPLKKTEIKDVQKGKGLGGAFFWELSGDTSNGELISALSTGLK